MAQQTLMQLVSFEVGTELFATPITKIQEIIRITSIVRIPKSPEFVEGVINLRGKVIPIIDLKKRFGLPPRENDTKSRIIVADINTLTVGMIVDAVCEVLRADSKSFEEAPAIVSGVEQKFIQGIVKRDSEMLIVLDLDKLLTTSETKILQTVK